MVDPYLRAMYLHLYGKYLGNEMACKKISCGHFVYMTWKNEYLQSIISVFHLCLSRKIATLIGLLSSLMEVAFNDYYE